MSAEPPLDTNPNQGGEQPPMESPAQDGRPKTPPNTKPPVRVNEDTPYKPSSTQAHEYLNGDLEDQREAAVEDLAYTVLELNIDYVLDFILPPLKDNFKVDDIISTLQGKGLVGSDGKSLTNFETKPKDSKVNEDKTFEPLSNIFEEVINAAKGQGESLEQTLTMRLLPDEAPVSRKPKIRPDGYFILKEADDIVEKAKRDIETQRAEKAKTAKSASKDEVTDTNRYWYDIAVVQEFKKRNTGNNQNDDVSKIVYGMQAMMSLDPSRRFAFGITIENTDMRVWFCSRGLVVVSDAFDFTTDAVRIATIYLKLAFASKEELGWDPTVDVLNKANDNPTCKIRVGDTEYETIEVLSSFAAETIVGRGTRVYKVKDPATGKQYVLKDVWIDDGRALEHDIRKGILEAVEQTFGTAIRELVEKHLLTPVAHWLVPVGEKTDHTVEVMMHGNEPPLDKTFEIVVKKPIIEDKAKSIGWSAASDNEVGKDMKRHLGTPLPRGEVRGRMKPHRRRHYRIVFEEVAEPLFVLTNLSDVFIALRDVAKVLHYIHGCGYVHRDISVGNLYLFDGRGLLGDLEYAKLKLDDLPHELRTGTLDFMAVEAIGRKYLFRPKDTENIVKDLGSKADQMVNAMVAGTERPTGSERLVKNSTPFFHNDLHDMESLWWIAIWELFFHHDKSQSEVDEEKVEARQSASCKLFPRYLTTEHRREFFRTGDFFYEMLEWLDQSLADVKEQLGFLCLHLHNRYQEFERTFPGYTFAAFQGVQATFQEHFDYCVSFASGIELVPFKTTGLRGTKANTGGGGRPKQMSPTVPTPPVVPGQSSAQAPAPEAPSEPSVATPGSVAVPSDSSSSSSLGKRKAIDDLTPRPQLTRPFRIIERQRQP